MNRLVRAVAVGAAFLLSASASSERGGEIAAGALAEQMLAAIGGRDAWAGMTNTVNESLQYRLEHPTVVTAVITMEFNRPRFRIETTAPGLHLVRVIDGNGGWRLTRAGTVEDMPARMLEADSKWYAGHVYRTIHRIAARDRALRLVATETRRLEAHDETGRIAWFALDVRGEPYAFGAHDDDVGSITGPWVFVRDGIHHPSWVARPDGQWRAGVTDLAVNVTLDDSMFARPDPVNQVSLAEIVDRHVEARGGAAALDAIHNVRTQVDITEPTFSVVADYRALADGRMRVDILAGDERVFSEGLDDDGAWQKHRGESAELLPVSDAGTGALRRGVEFNLFGLHRFAERGHVLDLVEQEEVDGVVYHVVKVTFADGFTTYLYVNPDSWLVDRQRDVRALHPDVDPESRMLESLKGGFETHCGVVWATRTRQVDMVTGDTVQATATSSQQCNIRDASLRVARDIPWQP